ncbi:MAG TPA: FHA domain-containing protein [Streptosporangiaceae bacterium]|nr:FHA domain-containing protein [Streptosporangiaceae bacterium]
MSQPAHPPGLWPVPGDGVLARHGSLMLLSSLDSGQFVDVLLDLLERVASAGGDGRQFADQVAALLEADETGGAGGGLVPSVLAFGAAGTGMAVTVSGGAWADVSTAHGTQRVEAGQPGMLIRCLFRSPVSAVRGGLGAAGNGAVSTDRFSRLDAGTVRASGLSYFAGGAVHVATPSPAVPAPVTPQPVAPQPVAPQLVIPQPVAPVVETPPQPQVTPPAAPRQVVPPPAPEPVAPVEQVPRPAPPPPTPQPPAPEPVVPEPVLAQPGTERWSAPDLADQVGGDLVTAPPADAPPFEPEPFEAVLFNAGPAAGADLGVVQRGPLSKARDIPKGQSSYVADAPIIQGVYCKNGHFDDPEALFCAVCGISMNQQTLVPRPGTRPPLGVLLLDDGSVFQLDRDYIVGREPGLDATVASGRSRALRIADDSGIVSRVHAKVQLDGWRVLITDLGSANGTRVKMPKQSSDTVLQPHVPVVLTTGSQVDIGGRGFRYESHRGR